MDNKIACDRVVTTVLVVTVPCVKQYQREGGLYGFPYGMPSASVRRSRLATAALVRK